MIVARWPSCRVQGPNSRSALGDTARPGQSGAIHLAGPVAGSPHRPRRQKHLSRARRLRRYCEREEVSDHKSRTPARNSLVPGGPLNSSQIGPPSGSTVMRNVRNLQHCRSISMRCAIDARRPLSGVKRRRYPSEISTRSTAWRRTPPSRSFRRAASAAGSNLQAMGRSVILNSCVDACPAGPVHRRGDGSYRSSRSLTTSVS